MSDRGLTVANEDVVRLVQYVFFKFFASLFRFSVYVLYACRCVVSVRCFHMLSFQMEQTTGG